MKLVDMMTPTFRGFLVVFPLETHAHFYVKSTQNPDEKKIKSRKHHIVVHTMGNLISVKVHAANIHDTSSGIWPAETAFDNYPEIQKFCAGCSYCACFVNAMKEKFQMDVDVVKRSDSAQ